MTALSHVSQTMPTSLNMAHQVGTTRCPSPPPRVKLRIQTAASQFELPPSEDLPLSQQDVDPPTQGPPPAVGVTAPMESEGDSNMEVSSTEPQEGAGQLPDGRGTSPVVEDTADTVPTPTAVDGNGVRCPCGFNEVRMPSLANEMCGVRLMLPLCRPPRK